MNHLSPAAKAFWSVFLLIFVTAGAIIAASLIFQDGERDFEESQRRYQELERRFPSE